MLPDGGNADVAYAAPEVLRFLNTELNRMITKPAIVTRFQELGAEPMGGTPEQAATELRELAKPRPMTGDATDRRLAAAAGSSARACRMLPCGCSRR